MQHAVPVAALVLLGLAAVLPFAGLGALAVVPVTAAIGGSVVLLWRRPGPQRRSIKIFAPDEEDQA